MAWTNKATVTTIFNINVDASKATGGVCQTGIYKNYRPLPKYIGFVHYRKYFDIYEDDTILHSNF